MDIEYIKNLLQSWFSFQSWSIHPQNIIFCQVSTISNDTPHLRTMGLYDITDDGCLVFVTETSTRKWHDLQGCKNIAIAILHAEHGQIIVEGEAMLTTSKNSYKTASFYWYEYLEQYWRDFYLSRSPNATDEIPSSFGVIVVKPYLWEILEINKHDYLLSSRKQFRLIDQNWTEHNVDPV